MDTKVLKPYQASDVLILDEFGYSPADPGIGSILYGVIATRYDKKATIITPQQGGASNPTTGEKKFRLDRQKVQRYAGIGCCSAGWARSAREEAVARRQVI